MAKVNVSPIANKTTIEMVSDKMSRPNYDSAQFDAEMLQRMMAIHENGDTVLFASLDYSQFALIEGFNPDDYNEGNATFFRGNVYRELSKCWSLFATSKQSAQAMIEDRREAGVIVGGYDESEQVKEGDEPTFYLSGEDVAILFITKNSRKSTTEPEEVTWVVSFAKGQESKADSTLKSMFANFEGVDKVETLREWRDRRKFEREQAAKMKEQAKLAKMNEA